MNAPFQPRTEPPPATLPRRSIPSIAGLIAFEATARHLSFSRAARDLALSQGAVSKRVRALEDTLGVTLLARSRHDVRLTPIGENYLAEVRRMLAEFLAVTEACIARGRSGGKLALTVPRALALHWLLPRLGRFRALHPGLAINLVAPGAEAAASAGAFVEGPPPLPSRAVPLWVEHLVPVAAPELAEIVRTEGMDAVERLHEARRPDLWARWDGGSVAIARTASGAQHDGLALVIEAALQGHGAALLPAALVRAALSSGRLVVLCDRALNTGRVMAFLPAPGRHDPVLADFTRWIADEATAGGAPP